MKKILAILILTASLATSCTKHEPLNASNTQTTITEDNPNGGGGNNTSNVPAAVLSAFNARYSNASNVQWKLLSDGNYKAEFFRGSVKWQATFTASGSLVKEEHQ